MEFSPATNKISVKTYSPSLGQFQIDANSQFVLNYQMTKPFDTIGVVTKTASGSSPLVTWNGLKDSVRYDWYVIVSDSVNEISSPIKTFTFKRDSVVSISTLTTVENGIVLFPNPNNGKNITLSYPKNTPAHVTIIDVSGKTVFSNTVMLGNHTTLPVLLTAGQYIINVRVDREVITKKLVVQ
jgi:hypothetical protein